MKNKPDKKPRKLSKAKQAEFETEWSELVDIALPILQRLAAMSDYARERELKRLSPEARGAALWFAKRTNEILAHLMSKHGPEGFEEVHFPGPSVHGLEGFEESSEVEK